MLLAKKIKVTAIALILGVSALSTPNSYAHGSNGVLFGLVAGVVLGSFIQQPNYNNYGYRQPYQYQYTPQQPVYVQPGYTYNYGYVQQQPAYQPPSYYQGGYQ